MNRFDKVDIVTLIEDSKDMLQESHDRFRRLPVFRNILRHIEKEHGNNVLALISKDAMVCFYRGTGLGVSIRDLYLRKDEGMVSLDVEVEWIYSDDSYRDYPPKRQTICTIEVPVELVSDFTEEKFNAWVSAETIKVTQQRREKVKKKLEKIISAYPDIAAEILNKQG